MIKEVITFTISKEEAGKRIDKAVALNIFDMSRSQIQDLIKNELVFVNNNKVKPSYNVSLEEEVVVKIPYPDNYDLEPKDLNLEIVYQDEYVAVVNKPANMVVHPAVGSRNDTLVHGLLYAIKDLSGINGVLRPGIVHRIDKDTSGLLMVAKNDLAHESLVNQLIEKSIKRVYYALVYGNIDSNLGKIDAPIGRDKIDRKKMAVIEEGRNAVTHFRVIERFKDFTLVECTLETGRTHQIRVHMKYIGHPLVGDATYGPKKVIGTNGQFLHAKIIGFKHPKTQKYMEFESCLPDYFEQILSELREKN